jgi:hypothetical protein
MKVIEQDNEKFVSVPDLKTFVLLMGESAKEFEDKGELGHAETNGTLRALLSVVSVVQVASGDDTSMLDQRLVNQAKELLQEMATVRAINELAKDFKEMGIDVLTIPGA